MRNWLPFLVYGAIGIAIALPAMILIGVVAGFLGLSVSFGNVGALTGKIIAGVIALVLLFMALGLVLTSVVFGSTYASYRDMLAPERADTGRVPPH